MMNRFKEYLIKDGKSANTINSYLHHLQGFPNWYKESYWTNVEKLHRVIVLDFISFLRNIKKDNAKTVNAKISALVKFNEFLIDEGIQTDLIISKKDNIKIQQQFASPTDILKQDIEAFRQRY